HTLSYSPHHTTPPPNATHTLSLHHALPTSTTYTITAAQLAQTTFVTGTVGDDIFMQASDGQLISNTGHITIGPTNHAPVLTVPSTNVSASAGQTIQASTLFSATDQDGDPLYYYLYDGTTDPNSGHSVVNGTVVAATTTYTITAAQLAQTTFVTGTVSDAIFMQASDGQLISNTGHITINVGSSMAPIANASGWGEDTSQPFTFIDGTLPGATTGQF